MRKACKSKRRIVCNAFRIKSLPSCSASAFDAVCYLTLTLSAFATYIMPRRGVQPSRQQQAFEMLLDQQYAADPLSTSAGVSSSRGKGGRQLKKTNRVVTDKRVSERLPGFVLRDSLHSEPPSQQPSARIEQLYSMFGALLDRSTIDQVLKCQHSVEAAIDELLSMSEHKRSEAEVGSSSRHLTQPSGTNKCIQPVSFHFHATCFRPCNFCSV